MPPMDSRLKEVLAATAAANRIAIRAMEIMPDRLRLSIEADPTL